MTRLPAPLTLFSPAGAGSVRSQGAQVLTWAPTGHKPVIWKSSRATDEVGRAVRGGVPICFPWFGPGRTGDLTPAHGFARVVDWSLAEPVHNNDDAAQATARFVLTHEDLDLKTRGPFTRRFSALFEARFGASLEMGLTVTNTDSTPWDFEAALHTYLAVGDVREVRVQGLDGAPYHDKVTGGPGTQQGELTPSGETDRVYTSVDTVRVVDPALARTVVVQKTGSAQTVVWNPWQDKCADMDDMADDGWLTMLCVEAASVGEHAVVLQPGESHTLTQRISVTRD